MFFVIVFVYLVEQLPPPPPASPRDPCQPNPCGANAVCRVGPDGGASCSCLAGYSGQAPYCRPECVSNSDCPSSQACVNQKCRDPCPGSCGSGAECRVLNHVPNCVCPSGYTGDPFSYCSVTPRKHRSNPPTLLLYPYGAKVVQALRGTTN